MVIRVMTLGRTGERTQKASGQKQAMEALGVSITNLVILKDDENV